MKDFDYIFAGMLQSPATFLNVLKKYKWIHCLLSEEGPPGAYGTNEFSTKQLEKDCKNAAYARIRTFVLKLESKGLLASQKYGPRTHYRVK